MRNRTPRPNTPRVSGDASSHTARPVHAARPNALGTALRRVAKLATGLLLGAFAGALAAVTHAGMAGIPGLATDIVWVGPLLATLLVASGASFARDWLGSWCWAGFWLGEVALTFWAFAAPGYGDIVAFHGVAANLWLVLAPLAGAFPLLGALARRRHSAPPGPHPETDQDQPQEDACDLSTRR
ncbi:hypothetical protein [Actinotignum sp. GS-2025c]|uniref:hypothetical protein n=1 Tax=Actinotignum sp. GS-2025c TaxID=3427276 RepID=UPI003F472841